MSIYTKIATSTLILAMSGTAFAATESPSDYAYGAKLELRDKNSAFHQVELPKEVYLQTLSPKLNDFRIFNNNGQPVTFALTDVKKTETYSDSEPTKMDIYPLDEVVNTAQNNDSYSVSIKGNNINVNVSQLSQYNNIANYTATYLLTSPDNAAERLTSFKFNWQPTQDNWQASANIYYSSDLKTWEELASSEPLMAVTNSEGNTLKLDEIRVNRYNYLPSKTKNWLVTITSQNPIPLLSSVLATYIEEPRTENATIALEFALASKDNENPVYVLSSPQPLSALSIELQQNNTVQPIGIYYKTDAESEQWIKLEDRIIRRFDGSDASSSFALNSRLPLIQAIQLRAINSSWNTVPTVKGFRNQVGVVFNSANNGPFILAWGSAQSKNKPAAIALQSLLSEKELGNTYQATVGDSITLSGDKALQLNDNSESSGFPQWIIWVCLIAGAGVLVFLGYKLSKEIKNS